MRKNTRPSRTDEGFRILTDSRRFGRSCNKFGQLLQFIVGVGIRHEHVPFAEFIGFCLVWVALIVLSVDGLRHQRSGARAARAAEAVPA